MARLIRLDDFRRLAELVREAGGLKVAERLFRTSSGNVEDAWKHTVSSRSNWWDLDEVVRRWNKLISGNPSIGYQKYVAEKYLGRKRGLRALSIGCGTGAKEILWADTRKFSVIDAYDLSLPRIEQARSSAAKSRLSQRLNFQVGDVHRLELPPASYDVVIFDNSLHHCSPLDTVLKNVSGWMKAGGILVFNEYVGPSRFQWTDLQVELTNALLLLLPERLRTMKDGTVKERMRRYGVVALRFSDPSEAAESHSIVELAEKYFRVCEQKPYGGTILANLLKDIAHNFQNGDSESKDWLSFLFGVEDRLMRGQIIPSDYVFGVSKKL